MEIPYFFVIFGSVYIMSTSCWCLKKVCERYRNCIYIGQHPNTGTEYLLGMYNNV